MNRKVILFLLCSFVIFSGSYAQSDELSFEVNPYLKYFNDLGQFDFKVFHHTSGASCGVRSSAAISHGVVMNGDTVRVLLFCNTDTIEAGSHITIISDSKPMDGISFSPNWVYGDSVEPKIDPIYLENYPTTWGRVIPPSGRSSKH